MMRHDSKGNLRRIHRQIADAIVPRQRRRRGPGGRDLHHVVVKGPAGIVFKSVTVTPRRASWERGL